MKKKELLSLVQTGTLNQDENGLSVNDIPYCKVCDKKPDSITFSVDNDLAKPTYHLGKASGTDIIEGFLYDKKIDEDMFSIIDSSIKDQELAFIGTDVLFQTILGCYKEHRPLNLSPDMIWLIICQNLSYHINNHAEEFRDKIVNHQGKHKLLVKSSKNLLEEKADWPKLLETFYSQIDDMTKGDLAETVTCDFTTTGANERLASVITLMDTVKTYFDYEVFECICGIPTITLKGTVEDWEKVHKKAKILKKFGLKWWYEWLDPILTEFVNASKGEANQAFWKSIVLKVRPDYLRGQGCIPEHQDLDGWFLALFPFLDGKKLSLDKCSIRINMENEMVRVPFNFVRYFPNGESEEYPMELWAGFLGVEEDQERYSLTPQIGWFVRQLNEDEETFRRLKKMDEENNMGIRIDGDVIPEYLKRLDHIRLLTINMPGEVILPDWLDNIKIRKVFILNKVSAEKECELKKRFKNIEFWDCD